MTELTKYRLGMLSIGLYKLRYVITFVLAILTGWTILAFAMTDQECVRALKKELVKEESFVSLYEENYDPFVAKELKRLKNTAEALRHAIKRVKER